MQVKSRRWGDIRDETHDTRVAIGFKKAKNSWKKAPAVFTKHALKIFGHPIMEDWERPYMRELARIATSRGGRVLELGFGMGISSHYIHTHPIKEHIIIEMNENVAKKARAFAKHAKHPTMILEGMWEEMINKVPNESLDGILFDTYPLSEREIHRNHFRFFGHAYKKLRPGGVFTYYSDEVGGFREDHLQKLLEAGFTKANIRGKVVKVKPPKNCEYWKSDTILAPIIHK